MPEPGAIADAAALLVAGDVVAFPTETVYGLGADATNPRAIARIFALKGRPTDHPLIVHVADPASIGEWTQVVPEQARALAARFWPGPLTLILPRSSRVPDAVTGGQDTVGIRCPSHPVAQALLRAFAQVGSGAVAAPSANRFGHVSPTTAQHVREELGGELMILDGGACEVGLESTIVDLSRGRPVLLRPGGISRAAIEAALSEKLLERDAQAPRASGTLAAHYAPRTTLVLVQSTDMEEEIGAPANVAVLALREPQGDIRVTSWITGSSDPARYAHDLYANLRTLDASGAKRIVVEAPPQLAGWEAVNDRLARAASGRTDALDDEP